MPQENLDMEEPNKKEQQHAINIFSKYGLEAMIGG